MTTETTESTNTIQGDAAFEAALPGILGYKTGEAALEGLFDRRADGAYNFLTTRQCYKVWQHALSTARSEAESIILELDECKALQHKVSHPTQYEPRMTAAERWDLHKDLSTRSPLAWARLKELAARLRHPTNTGGK
jgi:hypothetical protein